MVPAEAPTTMSMSEKGVPPSSLGKWSFARYETCSYDLLKADEVGEQNESGSPTKSRPNVTRVLGGSVRPWTHHSLPRGPDKASTINPSCATARGVYHRSLPGLGVSQGLVRALEQEQPSWIREREAETWHDTGSSAPKQITLECAGTAEDREDLHTIPGNLSAG
jgi:hypothetical protein